MSITRDVDHIPGLFFITLDQKEKAFLTYSIEGNTMILESIYTPEKYRGMQLAEEMTRKAVEYAKLKKMKIKPLCSYAVMFFQKHPEYKELLEAA
jgi:predicted GNAT family acetyltransferase